MSLREAGADLAPGYKADKLRSWLVTREQLRHLPAPAPLVDGYLYRDTLAVLYGPSGVGKSHVAIDLAMSVTARTHWFGREVSNGGVIYVMAEGASGVGARVDAWEQFHGVEGSVTFVRRAVDIFSKEWAEAMTEVVTEQQPALVVFDTFARCAVGAEENSARDMGVIVANLDKIRRAAGCCVLLVHHSGKSASVGARGSSALQAAADTELELTGGDGRLTLKNTKQKDAAEQPLLHLMLQPQSESIVVVESVAGMSGVPTGTADTLQALREIDDPGGISKADWGKALDLQDRTFLRHRKALLDRGLIVNVGSDKRPMYRPADAVSGAS